MNPKAKLELHPDADSLNAFVEHALPEGERAGIVAHLADCARCREVVYLAQSAAVGELVAPAVATKAAQPEWLSSTFAKWRMAWIPAAALAAVAAVVLWVHLHPAPARQETAQMVMPPRAAAPPEAAPATAAPGPTTRPERAFAPAHAAPGARRASRQAAAPSAFADDEIERDKAAPDARKRAFGAVHLDGHSASLAAQAPPPVAFSPPVDTAFQQRANPQFQQQANQADGFSNSALTARPAPAPAPVPPNIVAVHGAALAPDTGGPQRLDAEAASKMVITPDASNGYAMMRLARRARLPSGLNAVSSAAIMNRLLAVDSAGSVFLSQDGGKQWEPVPATWSGKALQVKAPPQHPYPLSAGVISERAVSASPSAPAAVPAEDEPSSKPLSPPATLKTGSPPPVPAMLFRLVTDRHKTWVSTDGKVWREQ